MTQTMNDAVVCPSCNNKVVDNLGAIPYTDIYAGRTVAPLYGGFLYQCGKCCLQFRYPALTKETTDKLYEEGSGRNWQENGKRIDWDIAHAWISSEIAQGNILDVGCFDGEFISRFTQSLAMYGVEINETATQKSQKRGIEVIGKDFSCIDGLEQVFTVVTAFDVFEHVPDPLMLLNRLSNATQKGGLVIISTGNTEAISFRLLGSRYWYCTIAEHIAFISPKWCYQHAPDCGLMVESIERFSHAVVKPRMFATRLKETSMNLLYQFTPIVLECMKRHGLGGKNISEYPELLDHPPTWMTAKDHFIVKFRKLK